MTIEDALSRLTAGLDRDEAIARAATAGEWEWSDLGLNVHGDWTACPYYCDFAPAETTSRGEPKTPGHEHRFTTAGVVRAVGYDDPEVEVSDADAAHIARQQPRQTLLQVEAIRKVLAEHDDSGSGKCPTCSPFYIYPCPTLSALAGIYTEPEEG